MTKITIGVPVYNGGAMLAECLTCLERQTFRDFEVLIYDNASEDATGAIARRFAERDRRFKYHRQPENKGPAQNFIDVMEAARSPYFLWRADDDLSDDNFLEVTHRLITATPGAKLAVGAVLSLKLSKGRKRLYRFPDLSGPDLWRIRRLLFGSHASWFYGLWDLAALKQSFYAAWNAYPNMWAHDHLTLYPLLIDQAVVGSNETRFIQKIVAKSYNLAPAREDFTQKTELMGLRRQFLAYCRSVLDERSVSPAERAVLNFLTWHYAGKRIYRTKRVLNYKLQQAIRFATVSGAAPGRRSHKVGDPSGSAARWRR